MQQLSGLVDPLRRGVVGDLHVHHAALPLPHRQVLDGAVDEPLVRNRQQLASEQPDLGHLQAHVVDLADLALEDDPVADHERPRGEDHDRPEQVAHGIFRRQRQRQAEQSDAADQGGHVPVEHMLEDVHGEGRERKQANRPLEHVRRHLRVRVVVADDQAPQQVDGDLQQRDQQPDAGDDHQELDDPPAKILQRRLQMQRGGGGRKRSGQRHDRKRRPQPPQQRREDLVAMTGQLRRDPVDPLADRPGGHETQSQQPCRGQPGPPRRVREGRHDGLLEDGPVLAGPAAGRDRTHRLGQVGSPVDGRGVERPAAIGSLQDDRPIGTVFEGLVGPLGVDAAGEDLVPREVAGPDRLVRRQRAAGDLRQPVEDILKIEGDLPAVFGQAFTAERLQCPRPGIGLPAADIVHRGGEGHHRVLRAFGAVPLRPVGSHVLRADRFELVDRPASGRPQQLQKRDLRRLRPRPVRGRRRAAAAELSRRRRRCGCPQADDDDRENETGAERTFSHDRF